MTYSIMIDATGADAGNIPVSTPKVAGYVTGADGVPWAEADWARFPHSGHVRIDQSPSLSMWASGAADVADMETGAASLETVIEVARRRSTQKRWFSFVYCSKGNYAALQEAVAAAELTGRVQYWIASWDLDEAEAVSQLGGDIVAVQWASPASNPDMTVPGGSQSLAEANVDLSVTVPGWFRAPGELTKEIQARLLQQAKRGRRTMLSLPAMRSFASAMRSFASAFTL